MRGVLIGASRILISLAIVCRADVALASSFTVNPTRIMLTSKSASAMLSIRNESSETLRFQLTVFTWSQRSDGEMELAPTQDIIFFPALFSLAPKQERNIRIGAVTPFGATEKTYRIFVEELPALEAPPDASGVRVLTRMGIPIFMRPFKPTVTIGLSGLGMSGGRFWFRVQSLGTVHVSPTQIRVTGSGPSGEVLFEQELPGWYILAGGIRLFNLELAPEKCQAVRRLRVDVKTDGGSVQERLETPAGVCKSVGSGR